MVDRTPRPSGRRRALVQIRLLWVALVIGQVFFAGFAAWAVGTGRSGAAADAGRVLLIAAVCGGAVAVLSGYFVRGQVYKLHWRQQAVAPHGYLVGNLILLAMMEAVSILAITGGLVGGCISTAFGVAFGPLFVQLINFPDGRAMLPTAPIFASHKTS